MGGGGGREEGGGEMFIQNTLELLVSRVQECIEVETAMCALHYTAVLHYSYGNYNWEPVRSNLISFLAFFMLGFETTKLL